MEENTLSDSVINALSLLKRVHRLSGSVAILHGKLIHAEVSLKAFSSDRFTKAVQSVFDGFAQRKRRAQRVALIYGGQNLVLICRGPMIVGFFFEKLSDLETVEAGINRFIEQFGTALKMDDPEPEVAEIEANSEPSAIAAETLDEPKSADVVPARTVISSPQLLKKIEVGEPEPQAAIADTDGPGPELMAILSKVLPPSVAATMTRNEVLAAIPDRRIRRLIENEMNELIEA